MTNPSYDSITWVFWSIEYELPNLSLRLTCAIDASDAVTEEEAVANFRKRRPHGRIKKINGRPVNDNGVDVTPLEDGDTESDS